MCSFAPFFARQKFMVLDGALATELESLGLNINDPLWSALALISHDELIEKVHLSYLNAGADIITSSSYQASVRGFMAKCLSADSAQKLVRKSLTIAKRARDKFIESTEFKASGRPAPLVAASLGPYGAYLADGSEYRGDYKISAQELSAFHQERIELLALESPDLYALETVPQLAEAVAVADFLQNSANKSPLWIAFSCRDATCISDGTPLVECARVLNAYPNIFALGVNCTQPKYIEKLIRQLRDHTDKMIIVYPNSGELYDPSSKTWSGSSHEFISNVLNWYKSGANLIGGCCRTTPADIAKIAELARSA